MFSWENNFENGPPNKVKIIEMLSLIAQMKRLDALNATPKTPSLFVAQFLAVHSEHQGAKAPNSLPFILGKPALCRYTCK